MWWTVIIFFSALFLNIGDFFYKICIHVTCIRQTLHQMRFFIYTLYMIHEWTYFFFAMESQYPSFVDFFYSKSKPFYFKMKRRIKNKISTDITFMARNCYHFSCNTAYAHFLRFVMPRIKCGHGSFFIRPCYMYVCVFGVHQLVENASFFSICLNFTNE